MDAAQNMVTSMSLRALKEPRGFIRILQVILAIFAFATTCSVSTSVKFMVECQNRTDSDTKSVAFSYPFGLDSIYFNVPDCHGEKQTTTFDSGAVAPSQFFVAVGVLAFLYSLAAIVLYVFFDDLYRKENKIIIGDFVVTAVFALFWLISSAAWADGLSNVKYNTDPWTGIFPNTKACGNNGSALKCDVLSYGDFSSLNVSIIFGFLNMVVWGGNIWFLYKETPWFKGDSSSDYNADSKMPQGSMGGSPTQPSAT